jgi:integrase
MLALHSHQCVEKYLTTIKSMSNSTAKEYSFRLNRFNSFVSDEYHKSIDILVDMIKEGHEDVYNIMSKYILYLQNNSNSISSLTLKQWVVTVKNFLEYHDVDISPRKFKLKVKIPKVVRRDKQALSKEDIIEILNACSDIRLKTYVVLLAATGMRAVEALSIRIKDIDFKSNPPKLFVRAETTKTKTDRSIFLTSETAKQIGAWLDYKHRTRRVCHTDTSKGRKTITEYRTPKKSQDDLVFGVYQISKNPKNLYVEFACAFDKTLDRSGMGAREDCASIDVKRIKDTNNSKSSHCHSIRRKITFHSFRRWVKSTISDLGYGDYSEYFLGHANVSPYYRKTEKERADLFRKIEPYLTFLDFNQLSTRQADISTALQHKEDELKTLKTSHKQLQDEVVWLETMVQSICDNYLLTIPTASEKKIMGQHRTPTSGEFAVIEKEKELRNERAKLLNQ